MWRTITHSLMKRTEAPTPWLAVRYAVEYAALRLWCLIIGCFAIETNLETARLMGLAWWLSSRRRREGAIENLRQSFGERYSTAELRRIARRSYEHFAQLYLVELALTPRIINKWSWARYVELYQLGPALRELLSERGVIMVTGHFGNYELLGFTICRLGIPLVAVMRPLDNPLVNRYLLQAREAGGLSLLYKKGATQSAEAILESGGALCFIGDQDAGRKGIFVDFFGRPASTYKSIGLLAMQQRVPIIVGVATRTGRGFRYRIAVERIIQPHEWAERDDPLRWITQTFSYALESAIRRAPEQYLWVHRRWKHQPKAAGQRMPDNRAATASSV
jgi:Kdo2-lipid IVA lauroyltransferase/acyltransferase